MNQAEGHGQDCHGGGRRSAKLRGTNMRVSAMPAQIIDDAGAIISRTNTAATEVAFSMPGAVSG